MTIKLIDTIVPCRNPLAAAGFAVALTLTATPAAFAGNRVHAADVAKVLSGKNFRIDCIDGTHGRGQVTDQGIANLSYRRSADGREASDSTLIQVKGVDMCLSWQRFAGGGRGCYPVSEEAAGRYRLSTGPLWCDISMK
jgi:hypothetical protein